jgi:hypothetical protein
LRKINRSQPGEYPSKCILMSDHHGEFQLAFSMTSFRGFCTTFVPICFPRAHFYLSPCTLCTQPSPITAHQIVRLPYCQTLIHTNPAYDVPATSVSDNVPRELQGEVMEDTFWHSRSWVKPIQASANVWNKCRAAHWCSKFRSCPLCCRFSHHRSRRGQLIYQFGEHLGHTGSETRTRARHLFLKAYLCSSNCRRRCEFLPSHSQTLCSLGRKG